MSVDKSLEQETKKENFIGTQFPLKTPRIIKKGFSKIIFSMKEEKFEINTRKEGNDKVIHEIERFLVSNTTGEDYEQKYRNWILEEKKNSRKRNINWVIKAIILIPLLIFAIYFGACIIASMNN